MITVPVELGERSYDVFVGPGATDRLPELIPPGAVRAAVVTQESIPVAVDPGVGYEVFVIGEGERAKSLDTISDLTRAFARWGLTRRDAVVAVGGGVVTDTAGFAAASYHRGVAVVHVATTLLGMIDAAIGGKTGVNIPEGKNLVGAFWQPCGVICDTAVLETLPPREYRSGLGEMAKYHFLTGDRLEELDFDDRVARCVAIKAEVVASDETEAGRRAILNYGHTLAHALESADDFDLRHGEAVGIGLVFAAHLAERLGRIDESRVNAHTEIVTGYDLPTRIPPGHDAEELVGFMARDKKAVRGLTFALDGPEGVEVVEDVPPADVVATVKELL